MKPYSKFLQSRAWTLAFLLIAAGIVALPIVLIDIPGPVDYLNHLARIHILANIDHSPELQAIYHIGWPPPPNVLGDIVLLAFNKVSNIYLAGRLYLLLCFTLVITGLILLTRGLHGKLGYWPLAGFLLLYNANLDYGFLNYLLALGLIIIAFALWLRIRNLKLMCRLLSLSFFSLLLFYAHLFGLGALMLLITAYEIGADIQDIRTRGWHACLNPMMRKWLSIGLALSATLVLAAFTYHPLDEPGGILYGGWKHKILVFLSPVGMGLDWLDPLSLAFILVPLMIMVIKGRVLPPMRPVLGVVFLLTLLTPHSIGGGGWFVDFRFPVLLLLLSLSSIEPDLRQLRHQAVFIVSLLALLIARSVFIYDKWNNNQARIQELIAVSPSIQKGSSILVVRKNPSVINKNVPAVQQVKTTDSDRYDWHLANIFVIERDAFTPSIFTDMNILRIQKSYKDRKMPLAKPITTEIFLDPKWLSATTFDYQGQTMNSYWGRWPERFDYIVLLNDRWDRNPYPRLLVSLHRGSFFELYKVSNNTMLRYR